jgi:uncharacterized protein YbaR (Trm112 family)
MKRELASIYRCPGTGEALALQDAVLVGDEVISGSLVSTAGRVFVISDGVPNLIWPQDLAQADKTVR